MQQPTSPQLEFRELTAADRRTIAELRAVARPEIVRCAFCDIESPEGLESAIEWGWTKIQIDEGLSWNYLGVCPNCRRNATE